MSSPATKLRGLAGLALAAATLPLAGCQNYAVRRDTIAFHAGEAAAYNRAVHMVDPWPAASTRADIDFDGPRAVRAIERYEQGEPVAAVNGAPGAGPMPISAPGATP
jgi:hypothetical protein